MSVTGDSFDNGQFWVNQNTCDEAGEVLANWHPHKIPHTTIVKFGKVRISLRYPDERIESFDVGPADRAIHVPANIEHHIECLKGPARTECLFLHRDHEWNIRETYCGFMAAYG